MLGIILGSVCLVALVGVLRRRRWHRYGFAHHGFGQHGFGHHGFGHPGGHGVMRWAFWRLETSHGQEQVLRRAFEELREELKDARGAWKTLAQGAGEAFAADQFDRTSTDSLFAQQDAVIHKVRAAAAQFMERAHEVLEPQQRAQVARWITARSHFGRY